MLQPFLKISHFLERTLRNIKIRKIAQTFCYRSTLYVAYGSLKFVTNMRYPGKTAEIQIYGTFLDSLVCTENRRSIKKGNKSSGVSFCRSAEIG